MANLVENENPTSTQSVPINDDTLPNIDTDNLENLPTTFNTMKGSYNNLFCDNLDDETIQTFDQTNCVQKTNLLLTTPDQLLENVYCNVSPIKKTSTLNGKQFTDTPSILNNVKNTNCNPKIVDDILTKSDPNLHVYSNISNATTLTTITTTKQSTPIVADIFTIDSITHKPNKQQLISNETNKEFSNSIESILSQSILKKSTNLLSENLNDLDLDDPTLVTGSIGNTPNTGTKSKLLKNMKSDTIDMNNSTVNDKINLSRKNKQQLNTTVDDIRTHLPKSLFNDSSTSTIDTIIDHHDNGNNSFFDSQRLRSLHDTTMIDTALDLDSLEDAIVAINTQTNSNK